jgi:hypothetical protein
MTRPEEKGNDVRVGMARWDVVPRRPTLQAVSDVII